MKQVEVVAIIHDDDGQKEYSVLLAKQKEMKGRLTSGHTSFWS